MSEEPPLSSRPPEPPPLDASFESRSLPGGIYDKLGDDIIRRPGEWLGSGDIEIGTHYHLVTHEPTRDGGWRRTTANWTQRAEEEVRVSMLGELCGRAWGTRISSRGTWVPGINDDGTRKVRDFTTILTTV